MTCRIKGLGNNWNNQLKTTDLLVVGENPSQCEKTNEWLVGC